MDASLATRIEKIVDCVSAPVLGGACAYAMLTLLHGSTSMPALAAEAAALGAAVYLVAVRILAKAGTRHARLPVPVFDVRDIAAEEPPELLLTEVHCAGPAREEALVLDDILAEAGPDSRVVRLFDPAAMPTPGQLNARIREHLGGQERRGPADASQALHDALAELRRSLA